MSLVPGTPDYLNDDLQNETNTQRLIEAQAALHGVMMSLQGMSMTSADGVQAAFRLEQLQNYILYLQPLADAEGYDIGYRIQPTPNAGQYNNNLNGVS